MWAYSCLFARSGCSVRLVCFLTFSKSKKMLTFFVFLHMLSWTLTNMPTSNFILKLEALRENKPPPNTAIRRIRISDFWLPDPKGDPDRHQNCITWSLSHALPLQKISSKSVHKFASNLTDRQTDRQTDRTKNITSFFGGGNDIPSCFAYHYH